jgi:hypothetical protein
MICLELEKLGWWARTVSSRDLIEYIRKALDTGLKHVFKVDNIFVV